MWRFPELLESEPKPANEIRVRLDSADPVTDLTNAVSKTIEQTSLRSPVDPVVLCIGSDRFIGDALGPLVGTLLLDRRPTSYTVLGDLSNTVHAGNLHQVIQEIEERRVDSFVVAVDASLGRNDSVGTICVAPGSLRPGAGVNKSLPSVGHMQITGVVNVGGFMEYFVLQNTRLGFVMRLAKLLAEGIDRSLHRLYPKRP